MDQPAAAGKTSTAEAAASPTPASTCSAAAPDKAKTHTSPVAPVPPSNSLQKPHNSDSKSSDPVPPPSATSTASTDGKTDEKAADSSVKTGSEAAPAGAAMDRALRAQEEARRLQFALAQQQVQQYQAMTKQLEAQSGIAMTPSSCNNSSSSGVTGLAKTSEDLQKLRTEQLARLQQNVQLQAAMAAQAVQKRSNEEWLRNKLLLEQEHLRLLRLHEQQTKQTTKGNIVTTATATSIADSLLTQQQQVLRQQQMLREMLQKQQKQQLAQRQLQMQLQKGGATTTQIPGTTVKSAEAAAQAAYAFKKRKSKTSLDLELEALARACIRVANARTDCEMRQALDKMTTWLHRCTELQLLQLAQRDYRDCIAHRRPLLVQQHRWPLDLQVKSEYITQKIVQMLSAFTIREKNKVAQQKAAAAAAKTAAAKSVAASASATNSAGTAENTPSVSTVATAGASPTTTKKDDSTPTTVGSATSSSSAGTSAPAAASTAVSANTPSACAAPPTSAATTETAATNGAAAAVVAGTAATVSTIYASPKQPVTTPATTLSSATPAAATATYATTTIMAPAVRIPVKRDMAEVEREYAELKAQLQAKQVETNQKAKAKRDAAKVEAAKAAGVVSDDTTTGAMLAATYKRPLQVEIPGSVKKPRTDSYVMQSSALTAYRPSTTTVPAISPRVAQQFYDLDLSTRASSESDDKMYLPPKIISKIMYRALPGTHEEEPATTSIAVKQEGLASKNKSHGAAISPGSTGSSFAGYAQQDQMDDSSVSISDDAVTFMQECVTEFLLYFTSEARDRSVMQNRRTKKGVGLSISGENVVESMENLGFTSYARVLAGYNEKVKASQDAAAQKKMEQKRLVKQRVMQQAAAANIAANAARAAAAGKSAVSSQSYLRTGFKPAAPLQYSAGRIYSSAAASTVSRVVPAAPFVRAVTTTASPVGRPTAHVTSTPSPRPALTAAVSKPAAPAAAVTLASASTAAKVPVSAAGAPPTK